MICALAEIIKRALSVVRSFLSVIDRLLMITRIMSDSMLKAAILAKTLLKPGAFTKCSLHLEPKFLSNVTISS